MTTQISEVFAADTPCVDIIPYLIGVLKCLFCVYSKHGIRLLCLPVAERVELGTPCFL